MDHQAPSLLNLPTEVLSMICDHIFHGGWGPTNRLDLIAFSRVHRRIYEIAAPELYRRIHLRNINIREYLQQLGHPALPSWYVDVNDEVRALRMPHNIVRFAAELERNPRLANMVQAIDYYEDGTSRSGIELVKLEAQFNRLLELTPNVYYLHLRLNSRQPLSFELTSAPGIKCLELEDCRLSLDIARHFPNLQSLDLAERCVVTTYDNGSGAEEPCWKHTKLEELFIVNASGLRMDFYCDMLKHFPSLKQLHIGDWLGGAHEHGNWPKLEYLRSQHTAITIFPLLEAIAETCPSIQWLHLSGFEIQTFSSDSSSPPAVAPLFPEFENLQNLSFSTLFLDYDSEVNPLIAICMRCPRLESLNLTQVHAHLEKFRHCLADFATKLGQARRDGDFLAVHLKTVQVTSSYHEWCDVLEELGAQDIVKEEVKQLRRIAKRWKEIPYSILFGAAGISYEEDLDGLPMDESTGDDEEESTSDDEEESTSDDEGESTSDDEEEES